MACGKIIYLAGQRVFVKNILDDHKCEVFTMKNMKNILSPGLAGERMRER